MGVVTQPDHNVPPVLYKYRSLADGQMGNTKRMFSHHEIYMSTRLQFNDPFDCRPRLSLESTKAQLRAYADRVLRKAPLTSAQRKARVREIVSERHTRLKADLQVVIQGLNAKLDSEVAIFCASALPDHILMWAHYADAHRGICVGFDTTAPDSPFRNARPVAYSAEYPVCYVISDDPMVVQERATFTKADVWAYEQEWRLIDYVNGPGVRRIDPRHMRQVVLGAQMSEERVIDVAALVRTHAPHVQLLRAQLQDRRYGLTLDPVV